VVDQDACLVGTGSRAIGRDTGSNPDGNDLSPHLLHFDCGQALGPSCSGFAHVRLSGAEYKSISGTCNTIRLHRSKGTCDGCLRSLPSGR
jgi:hypothetical protein